MKLWSVILVAMLAVVHLDADARVAWAAANPWASSPAT